MRRPQTHLGSILCLCAVFVVPLAARADPEAPQHPVKKAASKPRKAGHAEAKAPPPAPAPWEVVDPGRVSKAPDGASQPTSAKATGSRFDNIDPSAIDYGMKANGANVSPGQTRNQNYNGNVTGIGGELGMKLHF